jgi:putative cell wall-binding protein
MTPRALPKFVSAIATLALVLGVTLLPDAATASTGFTVSGTITYSAPAGSIEPDTIVRVIPLTGDGGQARTSAYYTISNYGAWSVTGVPAGRYRIEFDASGYDGGANAAIWYGGTPYEDQATIVTVAGDMNGLDVTQPTAGTISGTVTGPVTDVSSFQAYLWNPATGLFEFVRSVANANTRGTGNYTISGLNAGKYVVRFAASSPTLPAFSTQYYQNADYMPNSTLVTVAAGQDVVGIDGTVGSWGWSSGRIAGADRFATAVSVSSAFFTPGSANVVYIANGLSYPDALSASAAAAHVGGPLLLVTPTSVPASVTAEINRLHPARIVVVGGTGAVGASVYNTLATLNPDIRRVSGTDRYATSRAIAQDAFGGSTSGAVNSVFLATGANYPDALAAGSAAGYQGSPMILVKGTASSLDSATSSLVASLNPLRMYVIGGTGAVSSGIQHSLETMPGATTVLRLGGANRFLTAQAINSEVFPFADTAFVATAFGFADALAISAVAGVVGSPLILSTPDCMPYDEVTKATSMGVSAYWMVGGTNTLHASVENLSYCDPSLYGASAPLRPSASATRPPVTPADPGQAGFSALLRAAHSERP